MNFSHKQHYGRDFFYPENQQAKKFVEAFPHSTGKRKSLTLDQMQVMKEIGIYFVIKPILTYPGEENVNTGNDGI